MKVEINCQWPNHAANSGKNGWTEGPLLILNDATPNQIARWKARRPVCDACAIEHKEEVGKIQRQKSAEEEAKQKELAELNEKLMNGKASFEEVQKTLAVLMKDVKKI